MLFESAASENGGRPGHRGPPGGALAPARPAPPQRLLSGWGSTSPTRASWHVPPDVERVCELLAGESPRGTLARGAGRSYGDAAGCAGGEVISTATLTGIEWVEEGLVRVGAGTTLASLISEIIPRGWFLAVTPGTRFVTVGGAIAADVHGKNHPAQGSFGAHVRSIELVLAGGGRLTALAGEDSFRATVGGMGLTGVIVAATLALFRVETTDLWVENTATQGIDETLRLMSEGEHEHVVAWVDATAKRGRSIVTTGRHASGEGPLVPPAPTARSCPRWIPGGLLNTPVVRAFNEAKYRSATAGEQRQGLERFFYALDALADWNRLYGPSGLVQYQFALPAQEQAVIQEALERVAAAPCPCTLAVLKRLGCGTGLLSFPVSGWTLALDFPAGSRGLAALLGELDELVARARGRVYLAKDGRLRPELIGEMYPQLGEWRALRAKLDPERKLASDMSRRLGLLDTR